MSSIRLFGLSSLLLGALACGAPPDAATPTAPAATAPAAGPGPAASAPAGAGEGSAPAAWKEDLTREQKAAFMRTHVTPRMAKVFTREKDFGCKTCHGPNRQDPKDFLPKLALKDGKITAFADKPEVAKFMAEKVVPEMASVLGKQPYDPATKQGFGCMGCHTVEAK